MSRLYLSLHSSRCGNRKLSQHLELAEIPRQGSGNINQVNPSECDLYHQQQAAAYGWWQGEVGKRHRDGKYDKRSWIPEGLRQNRTQSRALDHLPTQCLTET